MKYLANTAKLHLKNFAGIPVNQKKEYPMGGIYAKKKDFNGLEFLFKDIKLVWRRPKILRKIKEYLSYIEEDY